MYLSGSSQKTETTKGLSDRRSLIKGTDYPNDGRAEKPTGSEKATQRLARARSSYFPWAGGITREGSFARARSWGILQSLGPSGAEIREEGAVLSEMEPRRRGSSCRRCFWKQRMT